MKKDIIYEDESVEVCYFAELKLGQVSWKKMSISSETYRKAYFELLDYSENVDLKNFISDGRLIGVVKPADRKWFIEYAVKRAAKNGLLKSAVIIKKDPFSKYYMNLIFKFVTRKSPIEMKIFHVYEDGLEWIKSKGEHLK